LWTYDLEFTGATRDNLTLLDDLLLRAIVMYTEFCVRNLGNCNISKLPCMAVIDLSKSSFIIQ